MKIERERERVFREQNVVTSYGCSMRLAARLVKAEMDCEAAEVREQKLRDELERLQRWVRIVAGDQADEVLSGLNAGFDVVAQDEGADDEAIAEIVRERDANDTGERLTVEELAESVGLDVPQDEGKP